MLGAVNVPRNTFTMDFVPRFDAIDFKLDRRAIDMEIDLTIQFFETSRDTLVPYIVSGI